MRLRVREIGNHKTERKGKRPKERFFQVTPVVVNSQANIL